MKEAVREFTLTEAARLIGRSSSTLRHQVQKGRLTARLVGKTFVVTEPELVRYATSTRTPPMVLTEMVGHYVRVEEI